MVKNTKKLSILLFQITILNLFRKGKTYDESVE